MRCLRIGVRFDPRHPAGGSDAVQGAAAKLLEGAALAERIGLDVLWVAERPTQPGALVPAALPVCAAMLARTERTHVATGLLPLPLHHPLRVAEDAATLDGLSAGRFELGVGLGADPEGFASYGLAREERRERFAEALELLRGAWSPGPVAFQGRHFRLPPTSVLPKPWSGGPPLWVGARSSELQRDAAEAGAGLVLYASDSPDAYLTAISGGGRVAWILPVPADAERAIEGALRALECSGPAEQVDLVFSAPSDLHGDACLPRALEFLAERIVPALRS